MKLSKQESKYRKRFIAEKHYDKEEQRIFDQAVIDGQWRYKKAYMDMRKGIKYLFMVVIATRRAGKAIEATSSTAVVAAEAMTRFAEVAKRFCKQ